MSHRIRLALVDEHLLFRQMLARWLTQTTADVDVLASVESVASLRETPGWGAPVVLLEPGPSSDAELYADIGALVCAGSRVVVVTGRTDPATALLAVRAGATNLVSKTAGGDDLIAAIHRTAAGTTVITPKLADAMLADPAARPHLSPQERRTLRWYAGGLPMKSVALRLGVTEGAVKSYVDRIRDKYERVGRTAPTKVDLYKRAVEDGYLSGT